MKDDAALRIQALNLAIVFAKDHPTMNGVERLAEDFYKFLANK